MGQIVARNVINRALASSIANDPGVSVTPEELLGVLRDKLRVLYARATRLNPLFSATFKDVAPEDGKWERPDGALRVLLIEKTTGGAEVNNVHVRDRFNSALPPRVFRLGNFYYSVGVAGQDPDNQADSLRFYFADDSPGVAGLDGCLPDWFPDEHADLLVILLQWYLSLKDKARADLSEIKERYVELLAEFDAMAMDADTNVIQRFEPTHGAGLPDPRPGQ